MADAEHPTKVKKSTSTTQALAPKKGSALYKWAQDKGYRNLFIANASGNVGVLISGIMEGNTGRIITPALNLARNLGATTLTEYVNRKFSKAAQLKANALLMGIPALTNMPLAFTAATTAEFLAVTVLIGGYTLKCTSQIIRAHRVSNMENKAEQLPSVSGRIVRGISKRVGIDIDKGKRMRAAVNFARKTRDKGLKILERSGDFMPLVLLWRGSMRTLDGIIRADPYAIGAGIAYILGAGSMAAADHGIRTHLKQNMAQTQDKAQPASK